MLVLTPIPGSLHLDIVVPESSSLRMHVLPNNDATVEIRHDRKASIKLG